MTCPTPGERDPARFNTAIRQLYAGGSNNTGTVTLRANQTTTVVNHQSCNPNSHISLTPLTESGRKIIVLPPKLFSLTRVLSVASGSVAYTGLGFKPSFIQFQTGISGGATWMSFGQSDVASNSSQELALNAGGTLGAFAQNVAGIQRDNAAGSNWQSFVVTSFDADGFTLAWTKTGTPTATASVSATCFPDASGAGTLPAGLRISSRSTGSFTITHPSRADIDQTYTYSITGGA